MHSKLVPFLLSFLYITCVAGIPALFTPSFNWAQRNAMFEPYPDGQALQRGDIISTFGTGAGMYFTALAPNRPENATVFILIMPSHEVEKLETPYKTLYLKELPGFWAIKEKIPVPDWTVFHGVELMKRDIADKVFDIIMDVYNKLP